MRVRNFGSPLGIMMMAVRSFKFVRNMPHRMDRLQDDNSQKGEG